MPLVDTDAVCARCGACLSVCPVYRSTFSERLAPRGKHMLLSALESGFSSPSINESISACLQCGACEAVCSAGIAVNREILAARADNPESASSWPLFWKVFSSDLAWSAAVVAPPFASGIVYRLAALLLSRHVGGDTLFSLPAPSSVSLLSSTGLKRFENDISNRLNAHVLDVAHFKDKRIAVFAGCVQNFVYPEIVTAMATWFPGAEFVIPRSQCCCGLPAFSAGAIEPALKLIARNVETFYKINADVILTGCASCSYMIRQWADILKSYAVHEREMYEHALHVSSITREFTELAALLKISSGMVSRSGTIAFHAPCHAGFSTDATSASQLFLEKACGDHFVKMDKGCCGHGGSFSLLHPGISGTIFDKRIAALQRSGAGTLITTCSGCLMQWRSSRVIHNKKIKVLHAAEIAYGG